MIILWETAEQANRALNEYGQRSSRHSPASAITTGNRAPISVWEVNARV
jgi:hypothetical protein